MLSTRRADRHRSLLLSLSLLLSSVSACVVTPRFPTSVATAVNRESMRVLRTEHIDLYYPARFAPEAEALARRAEGCAQPLSAFATGRGGLSQNRIELIFPALPFNNAFVAPPYNGDFFSVVPTHWNMEITTETGLLPGPGYVACHELVHYVQAQQTLGAIAGIDRAFGALLTPQVGLDPWFWEGVATYYEQRLQPGSGRPAWPAWEGMFHAAVAERPVTGGDLSVYNRKLPWGTHYLYGSHFIHYLIHTYGELKLWQLIERQGRSFFFPFIVNQRFERVYGKRLSQLLDDFAQWVAHYYPARERPADQRVVRELGMNGRYARAPNGVEAIVSDAMDVPATLTLYAADGRTLYTRRLVEVLPKRRLVEADSRMISGLSFSRDGRFLYFVAVDADLVFQEARLLRFDLVEQKLTTLVEDLSGLGGDVSPDGAHYLFVHTSAQGQALRSLELATGQSRELYRAPAGVFLAQPRFSPDGKRLVASIFERAYALAVFDVASGARLSTLSLPGQALSDPSFIDGHQLLFLGGHEGRFQVFSYDLAARRTTRLSSAPYLAIQPRSDGKSVRFLNREGFRYTLDELRLPTAGDSHAWLAAPRILADGADAASAADAATADDAATPDDASEAAPAVADAGILRSERAPTIESAGDAGLPSAPAAANAPAVDRAVELQADASADGHFAQAPDGGANAQAAQKLPAEPQIAEGVLQPLPPFPELALGQRDDAPYRAFPRVFIPSIRAPQVEASSIGGFNRVGFYLGGTDALGKHRWGAHVGLQPLSWMWSGGVGYLNTQLSPLALRVDASQLAFDAWDCGDSAGAFQCELAHDRRIQRDLTFSATVPLRTTELTLSLHSTNDRQPDAENTAYHERTLSGGTLDLNHVAVESTPMSGPRRGYAASLELGLYPEQLGTLDSHVGDLAGYLIVYSPLPVSKRHTLKLTLRARALLHGESEPLLEVGGVQPGILFDEPDRERQRSFPGVAPKRRFRETLRGFETYGIAVDRIGVAELRYLYPLIIDRGTATSLSILPAFFFRQIDFELFASAAADDPRRLRRGHLAFGGAVSARFVWLSPFTLQYQLSKRVTDDQKLQHLLVLSGSI